MRATDQEVTKYQKQPIRNPRRKENIKNLIK